MGRSSMAWRWRYRLPDVDRAAALLVDYPAEPHGWRRVDHVVPHPSSPNDAVRLVPGLTLSPKKT